ncbi:RNA-binding protein [Helicobacter muridarum]|uniref:RNA-binding protein n=1 Tax=Helicobacter muridarum TaxID=216 RepID=A0A099TUG3_9HELI|nr:RNA-binding protein [Helicobacter muridarum]TLD98220.1 RNA-binding protein [Helicobacter muridarum]STQ87145.1 Rna-binding protein [Helicobacter muridarum]
MQSIYVGNLCLSASWQQVMDLFAQYGDVISIRIIKNRQKCYAFIEMEQHNAEYAIQSLNEFMFLGRTLRVGLAKKEKE